MCVCLTCNDSRYPPANGVVEAHVAVVDVSDFSEHTVNVQTLHKRPGKRAHVEIVQEDGYYRTYKLERERERETVNIQQKHSAKFHENKWVIFHPKFKWINK